MYQEKMPWKDTISAYSLRNLSTCNIQMKTDYAYIVFVKTLFQIQLSIEKTIPVKTILMNHQ